VTPIAERDQMRRFIRATRSTRDQMMHIRFALLAVVAAFRATPGAPSKHAGAHLTPMPWARIDKVW